MVPLVRCLKEGTYKLRHLEYKSLCKISYVRYTNIKFRLKYLEYLNLSK